MTKLKIGIDLDNCVYDFSTKFLSLVEIGLQKTGVINLNRWDFGLSEREFNYYFDCFCENKMFQSLDLFPNAQETLCLIENIGGEIHYITIRPKNAIRPTLKRILKDGLPISGIVFCKEDEKKIKYAKDNEISLAIEDKPDIIEKYEQENISTIKVSFPYNINTKSRWTTHSPNHWKNIARIIRNNI